MNRYADDEEPDPVPAPDYTAMAAKQVEQLKAAKRARKQPEVAAALGAVEHAARTNGAPLMEPIIEAVRVRRRWVRCPGRWRRCGDGTEELRA